MGSKNKILSKISLIGNIETSISFRNSLSFLLVLIFGLNMFSVYPAFFPNLSEINMFDECVYINRGRLLAQGILTGYANNPLVSSLYMISYIPVRASPFWLIHACGIGRFVLVCLLWISTYLMARQMNTLVHPLIMVGCLFVSPAVINLLGNPSDALFSVMSGLAFWQVLSFYQSRKICHLWLASAFVGLASLSRNDGLSLGLILIILSALLGLSLRVRLKSIIKRLGSVLVASIIPFGAIVAGYLLLYGFVTGSFELGIDKRSYVAFEQGQGVAYRHLYTTRNPFIEGQVEARRLFGNPEENQYSVLNAIRRNPGPFFRRAKQILRNAPMQIFNIYGHELGLLFFVLVGMGIVELIRKKMYLFLLIVLLWPLHLLVYLAFFFRDQYFLFPFFIVFFLTCLGLTSMISNPNRTKDFYFWLILLAVVGMIGLISNKAGLFAASAIIAIGFLFMRAILIKYRSFMGIRQIGFLVALCIALILKGGYISPEFRTLGSAPDEKAALFMREHLKPGTRVGAYAPGNVWIAEMTHVPMYLNLRHLGSEEEFSSWIKDQKCEAIYINNVFKNWEPSVYQLIERQKGKNLRSAFISEDKTVEIVLVGATD